MVADCRQNLGTFCRPFPGTEKVLCDLRARGYKLGIVTNGTARLQRAKAFHAGLLPLFDVVLISEEEKIKKPDTEIFTRAAERLGVGVQACAFVGDMPHTDIVGANAAGMTSVWLQGSFPWPPDLTSTPHHIVRSLAELLDIGWDRATPAPPRHPSLGQAPRAWQGE
jgi:putative hydrolase of the HAD superfamily